MTLDFALLVLVVAASMPVGLRPTPQDSLPRWLVGCWQSSVERERSHQRWIAAGETTLFGASWTVQGGSLVALDVLRLSTDGDSLTLDLVSAVPEGEAPMTLRGHALRASPRAVAGFEAGDETTRVRVSHLGPDGRRMRHVRVDTVGAAPIERDYQRAECEQVLRQEPSEAGAMRRLHEADERAVVAGDADALERLWTDDIVALAPGSPPRAGREANAAGLRRSLAKSREVVTVGYRLLIDHVHVMGDHAIEWGRYEGRVRARSDSTIITATGTMLRVIRRGDDGAWRVARTMFIADR